MGIIKQNLDFKDRQSVTITGTETLNYDGDAGTVVLTGASTPVIEAITADIPPTDGKILTLYNTGSVAITLEHQETGGDFDLDCPTLADYSLPAKAGVTLAYDATNLVWVFLSH